MIRYKDTQLIPNGTVLKFPILHRVTYNEEHEKSWHTMHDWCKENCAGPFYWAPAWAGNFIEFEDDEDAFRFGLRWG